MSCSGKLSLTSFRTWLGRLICLDTFLLLLYEATFPQKYIIDWLYLLVGDAKFEDPPAAYGASPYQRIGGGSVPGEPPSCVER